MGNGEWGMEIRIFILDVLIFIGDLRNGERRMGNDEC